MTAQSNRTPPISVNKLTMANQFKLMNLVKEEYTASKMSDKEFAVLATERLNIAITFANIAGCREALEIESNKFAMAKEKARPKNRLEEIEARISRLEALAKELGWKL